MAVIIMIWYFYLNCFSGGIQYTTKKSLKNSCDGKKIYRILHDLTKNLNLLFIYKGSSQFGIF